MQPGHTGGAGHTAQTEHRNAPDVVTQSQPGHQSGVNRGRPDAGDGHRHQHVDVGGQQAYVGQRFLDSLLAKVCCAGQEGIVGLPEVGDPSVVLERQHEMPAANATCGVETLEHRALLAGESEPVGHCGGDLCLLVAMGR